MTIRPGRGVVARAAALLALTSTFLAGATGPVAADAVAPPHDRRAGVLHLWFAGTVAQAVWSTCGEDPRPGTVCTTTDVMAFLSADREQAGSEYQLHSRRTPVVKLFQGSCEVRLVGDGTLCVPLEERFGSSSTGSVAVTPSLDVVTAAATVPVQVWQPDAEAVTGSVDVTVVWAGTGELVRRDERGHQAGGGPMSLSGTRGWERGCTAVGDVDEVALPGNLVSCGLFRVRQVELRVFPGGNT